MKPQLPETRIVDRHHGNYLVKPTRLPDLARRLKQIDDLDRLSRENLLLRRLIEHETKSYWFADTEAGRQLRRNTMKLGLYGINLGPCVDPEAAAAVARAAEDAGFESLWTAEHVVLPDPQVPPSPVPAQTPFLDPAVSLAHVAAHTRTIRLATGIIILPQRNPLVLAKELASVDVLSGGRLIFGIGAGYLRPEFDALGAPFADRGERTDEYIEAIQALWSQEKPRFTGRFVSFDGIDAQPRPLQKPHPPIVVGGMSPPALRRTVRYGNGWYGFALDLDATAHCIQGLSDAQQRVERPAALGTLEISVTPSVPLDRDSLRRFQDLGVERLVALVLGRSAEDLIGALERTAGALVGAR